MAAVAAAQFATRFLIDAASGCMLIPSTNSTTVRKNSIKVRKSILYPSRRSDASRVRVEGQGSMRTTSSAIDP